MGAIALVLGIVGFLIWPLAYASIPTAGHNSDWIRVIVPLAEWGAIACAIGAISLGRRVRHSEAVSTGAIWAPRLGWSTLGLMATAFLIGSLAYREVEKPRCAHLPLWLAADLLRAGGNFARSRPRSTTRCGPRSRRAGGVTITCTYRTSSIT